jgi:hypothetical protein
MVTICESYSLHQNNEKFLFSNFQRELNHCVILLFISFFSLAQVNFWVNGGWDQPRCGFVVNPLFFLQLSTARGIEGKDNNAPSYCLFVFQNLYNNIKGK